MDITIKRGTRGFITGTSGSGKTALALRLCEVMPSPLIVLDTKYDPSIRDWAKKNKIQIWNKKDMPTWRSISNDMVVRPRASWLANPLDIDWWLGQAFFCKYVPSIYIDEGYQVGATVSRMGQGVAGLWTRGRAFGMRSLIGAQRPAWINKFVMSESDILYIGMLRIAQDRETLVKATGFSEISERQNQHHFLYVKQDGNEPVRLKPIDIGSPSLYRPGDRYESRIRMRGLK